MCNIIHGFDPIFDKNSKVLILGSFPSVKSRKVEFYYSNKQNRFWRVLSLYFNESIPESNEEKREFLLKHNIALWDVVTECEIVGSKDSTIKNFKTADLNSLLQNSDIGYIILNGGKAFSIFEASYKNFNIPYIKLPSTSPANTHFNLEVWHDALSTAFTRT